MVKSKVKYVFVTGGVVSSLGKGIAASSLGLLLKKRGFKVALQKFDPYLNVDPGTMNPFQHGEVYVLDDGAETDLDLGHYERFLDESCVRANNVTTGQVYDAVIQRERKGDYLGATVQVIPHITNEIKARIRQVTKERELDIVITEIGGTVGDIEGLPFLEAIRQMGLEEGRDNVMYVHLTLVPYIGTADEFKTKPTQHSVKELRSIGIQPNALLARCAQPLSDSVRDVNQVYTHQLDVLLRLSGLQASLRTAEDQSVELKTSWSIVSTWSEASRYEMVDPFRATAMVDAVGDANFGVLQWLRQHW